VVALARGAQVAAPQRRPSTERDPEDEVLERRMQVFPK